MVFGCYQTSGPIKLYAFNEINCSVPGKVATLLKGIHDCLTVKLIYNTSNCL